MDLDSPSEPSLDHPHDQQDVPENEGDYSARMEELFDSDHDESFEHNGHFGLSDDDENARFGLGEDSSRMKETYKDQLKNVLGSDHEEDVEGEADDDELEEKEVENSLVHGSRQAVENDSSAFLGDDSLHLEVTSDNTPSTSSINPFTPPRMSSPPLREGTPSKLATPFLHPTISRLRSFVPHSAQPSVTSIGTTPSNLLEQPSPAPSHFSALSPVSSSTNLQTPMEKHDMIGSAQSEREVFRWTQLHQIGNQLYTKTPLKASAILGSPALGSPLVLAANGMICVGTDTGRIFVYDFQQTLKCVCGDNASEKNVGPVTALAMSHDHTYVASGHAFGHVQIFDLTKPQVPARFVPPTSLASVGSGRKEGHLLGSRIVNIDFVAGRHTAVVTADENGLAFYHSLGKVLFVDATDVLRILGKYPEEEPPPPPQLAQAKANGNGHGSAVRRKPRKTNTILAMAPLPLGTTPHPTDEYNVVALLTAAKLVIVGLKPSPKTWYRRHRDGSADQTGKSKFRAAMAWFPSVVAHGSAKSESIPSKRGKKDPPVETTIPMLVYSWGPVLHLLRVTESKITETAVNQRTGKTATVEIGRLSFEEAAKWSVDGDVLAIQWLNANQIIVATLATLEVYDVLAQNRIERVRFDASSLISPTMGYTSNGTMSYSDSLGDIAHSVRTYKGKVFLLGRQELQVGTLLTWADRILSFVQEGDFLSAIDLTRAYYLGTAPGNKNGLPDDPQQLKNVVEQKMRELMTASTRYAFSEDRMTDGTHITPDGRGVDRTSLFEGLVATCARACIVLDDFEFLFEDLFQCYDDCGITRIYLEQLEIFILDNDIRYVPPRIAQRLIAMHEDDNKPDLAERVIWHIDPECLDINQSINLCQKYHLYDALIYVYTRAMKDYVAPIVELLELIRKVMQYRRDRPFNPVEMGTNAEKQEQEQEIEPVVLNAYKIFPYMANVLSGLTYPSEEPLEQEEASQAKQDVYGFVFNGRSTSWPAGESGRLVLTAEEEGRGEPTYPYCRLLLRFDAEAFLHSLDLAFEDAYLNDESQGASRLVFIKVLLEVVKSQPGLSPGDMTFVYIFIARNVPKYPQFIQMSPSSLSDILIGLATDPDPNTREDRQLAAEYLLSVYTPDESDHILHLFEKARFFRILRSWHRQERQWAPLFLAYLHDPDVHPLELFRSSNEIFKSACRSNKGAPPEDLLVTISDSLPHLTNANVMETALFIDAHTPQLHEKALETLGPKGDHARFAYLRCLLAPPTAEENDRHVTSRVNTPSSHLSPSLRQLYVTLHCQFDPAGVIPALEYLPLNFLAWDDVVRACEEHESFDAAVWALNRDGRPSEALSKLERFDKILVGRIATGLVSLREAETEDWTSLQEQLDALETVSRIGGSVCLEHSKGAESTSSVEDFWFRLLCTQIDAVQSVSSCCSLQAGSQTLEAEDTIPRRERQALQSLRMSVQKTFSSLVSVSSSKGISFPRLFKRLVGATSHSAKGTPYTEFRTILTSMMDTYRSEGDMLIITKHLLDRDLFETVESLTRERAKGWAPSRGLCQFCRQVLSPPLKVGSRAGGSESEVVSKIVVSRTGKIYHSNCLPSDLPPSTTVH